MALLEGQFSLDGYLFGTPSDPAVILTGGWDTGTMLEPRTQDVELPMGDGLMFGRDFLSPPTWTFTMGVRDFADVYGVALEQLITAWRADAVRAVPGRRSELRYCRNGVERLVYGRPRSLSIEPDEVADPGWKLVTAQFKLAEVQSYGAGENIVTINQVTSTVGTGLVLPATLAWTLLASSDSRAGMVTMSSAVPASFVVEVNGPSTGVATDIKLWTRDWLLHFGVTLGPGDKFTYDTATGLATRNGYPTPANLKGTSTARAKMTPGSNEVIMTSTDTSNTVTAAVRWRDVFASL